MASCQVPPSAIPTSGAVTAQGTQPLPAVLEAVKDATGTFLAGLPQGGDQTVVLLRRR
jgi:hypothetical protein